LRRRGEEGWQAVWASLKGHPNLKPGAEGPEEHDPTPEEIMPPIEGKD
jgi:hypothetical protein